MKKQTANGIVIVWLIVSLTEELEMFSGTLNACISHGKEMYWEDTKWTWENLCDSVMGRQTGNKHLTLKHWNAVKI